MDVVVLTSSGNNNGELNRLIELFDHGLETLHVRKPKMPKVEVEEFIVSIPKKYHNRIIIHGHYDLAIKYKLKGVHLHRRHRSNSWRNRWKRFLLKLKRPGIEITATFHTIQSLTESKVSFSYVFLGQMFTSSSMFNSSSSSGIKMLKKVIGDSASPVYALGGISNDKLDKIQSAGFHGVGLSSAVFNADSNRYLDSYFHFAAA